MIKNNQKKPQIIIFQPLGNTKKICIRIESKNFWLTQKLITELFEILANRNFLIVQKDENHKDDKTCYFQELLQRISNIRSSKRKSYQKVIDVYATSFYYNLDTKLAKKFFAMFQNKIYFVVCGKTTFEIVTKKN